MKHIATLCLVLSLAMSTAAAAATATIKMSYNGPPSEQDNAVHYFATTFKNLLEKETDGQVRIVLYPNSQLGDEEQRIEQVANDPVINVASYGGVQVIFPQLFAPNIPFLFNSYQAAHKFFDASTFMDNAREALRKRANIELLDVIEEGGFLAFTSNTPIHGPQDFKGLTFRAMDASQEALYAAFGASGVPIPWTEVYLALKTGVADGQMNPPLYIVNGSLYEVQQYLTLANIQYSDQFLLINGDLFDSFSPQTKAAVTRCAHEATVKTRAFVESQTEARIRFLKEKGMIAYVPTTEEMARFRKLGGSAYVNWLKGKIDQSWIDLAQKEARRANAGVQ